MNKWIVTLTTLTVFSLVNDSEIYADADDFRTQTVNLAFEYYDDATITIGVYENGESNYYVYTADDSVEAGDVYNYEIGSVTKTLNGILVANAVNEGTIDLDASLDEYLVLDEADYPTIRDLLTHTGGYSTFYLNQVTMQNSALNLGFSTVNPFTGVQRELMLEEAQKNVSEESSHHFEYSNFSSGLIGIVLEEVEGATYSELMADLFDELEMHETSLFDLEGDFEDNWKWLESDSYAPAGAIVSNIEDMLKYLEAQLDPSNEIIQMSHGSLKNVDANSPELNDLGIYFDDVAYQWILDNENDIVMHDGQTSGYGTFLGFNKEQEVGVVVLTNLPIDSGGMPTVIGYEVLNALISE